MNEFELYTKQKGGEWIRFGLVEEVGFQQVDKTHKVDITSHSLSGYTLIPDRNTEITTITYA